MDIIQNTQINRVTKQKKMLKNFFFYYFNRLKKVEENGKKQHALIHINRLFIYLKKCKER